ncbi:MAG: hypothetical protein DRJ65_06290 [Acidobacteria bacterium]|nr:MAG: hypothetical protein DRJ65_06290 [Acidobacteriota bacterium]
MMNGFEKARDRRNWLEKLGEKIPGFRGYLDRELRREVDKMQRDFLASEVDRARQGLQAKIRGWSRKGVLDNLDIASTTEKLLDRLANRIRHADYGSSGFFDAVKIGEAELEELYRFDLELSLTVEALSGRIGDLPETPDEGSLFALLDGVEKADRFFDERSTKIENVTQKGVS